jgi:hypothetical protein
MRGNGLAAIEQDPGADGVGELRRRGARRGRSRARWRCGRGDELVLLGQHGRHRVEIDLPSRVSGATSMVAPTRSATSCQGTMLL